MSQSTLKVKTAGTQTDALEISFATDYVNAWGDWGSGANTDFRAWKPVLPAGFAALGHFAKTNYDKPTVPMICVKAIAPDALAHPTDYRQIWGDWGSGADQDGSFWEPIPPRGYKALGTVVGNGYSKPALRDVVCVREDLVTMGIVGERIWGDWGSGANDDVTFWQLLPPTPPANSKQTYITSGSFCGHSSYDDLRSSTVANALAVELPIHNKQVELPLPTLAGTTRPVETTQKQLASISYLPCTMVADPVYAGNLQAQVTNTPFYRLEKYVFYKLQSFDTVSGEGGTVGFSYTVGMSESEQKTISHTIGVSMTAGYSSPNTTGGPNFSVTVSYSFALSESFASTITRSTTRTQSYAVPANGAGALYSRCYEFYLKRADGTTIKTWELPINSTHFAVYPSQG